MHGGITSASREAIRPILQALQDALLLQHAVRRRRLRPQHLLHRLDAGAERQQAGALRDEEWGKKIYIARGRLQLRPDHQQVGDASTPRRMAARSWRPTSSRSTSPISAPTIKKIQAAKPDIVISLLVGGAHISFYRQWAAAGMKQAIPMASTTFGGGNEQRLLTPEEGDGIIVAYSYFQELDTPANKAFLEKLHGQARRQRRPISATSSRCAPIMACNLWAEGVRKAGIDRPHEGDRGAGDRHRLRRPGRQDHDRPARPTTPSLERPSRAR